MPTVPLLKLKCLTCEALARVVYLCAARSPHVVDVELLKIGLHSDPDALRARLQEKIEAASSEAYDAVVMAYGLCGKATHGLTAHAIPVVIPRAHDCITLFLGARTRYQEQFTNHPGTYWYVQDYIERTHGEDAMSVGGLSLGVGTETENMRAVYDEYVAKYGKDNADYLMEVMGAWQQHYNRAAYIDMGVGDGAAVCLETQAVAARRGWTFERLTGDLVLIRRLLDGDWATAATGDDFLILAPGQQIEMSYDESVVRIRN
ncbi:MAG: DUF1638 domain-containing protein [Anaerolineae bacterium]|nr:DUF1638 domain-containing protein [Anaerolineae bacterium]